MTEDLRKAIETLFQNMRANPFTAKCVNWDAVAADYTRISKQLEQRGMAKPWQL